MRKLYLFLLVAGVASLFDFSKRTIQTGGITLNAEPLAIKPGDYYIAGVVDQRRERTGIAALIDAGKSTCLYYADLQGGAETALNQFVRSSLPRDTSLRPVIIGLKKFNVTETAAAGGKVEGHVSMGMSFGLKKDDDTLHLVDYNAGATYERSPGPAQAIAPTLAHVLQNGLLYFNTWMEKRAGADGRFAKSLQVTFADYSENPEGDTIYYSAKRPLTWDDFKSRISSHRYDAEVYPTIGYSEHTLVKNSVVSLKIELRVALPKSACWVRGGGMSDYALNHEQRHFDIAKIAAEHFKRKLASEQLPVDNYDGFINCDYLDAYREMDKLQEQYDKETDHGANHAAQEEWDRKIDEELRRSP